MDHPPADPKPLCPWDSRATIEEATTAVDMDSLARSGVGSLRVVRESQLAEILDRIVESAVDRLEPPTGPSPPEPGSASALAAGSQPSQDGGRPPTPDTERFRRLEGLASQLSSMSERLQGTLRRLESPAPAPPEPSARHKALDVESRRRLLLREMLLDPPPTPPRRNDASE
jgi:hypothetical protein